MTLSDLVHQTGEWLRGSGPHGEIVMSARVRLARNLSQAPFPQWATPPQRAEVLKRAVEGVNGSAFLKGSMVLELKGLSELDRLFLVERHLISREHATGGFSGAASASGSHATANSTDSRAVVVSDREIVSLMVNEEDHLRLQVLQSGFNLQEAWVILNRMEEELERKLPYAFSAEWGYLTACPTNVGTGMRASTMLHLPCLVMTKQINRVLHAITKLGLTARGLYGEGTEATGNFFQLSNQVSLGISEEEILDNLERLIKQVIEQEEAARKALLNQSREALEDRIWRAYGTLKSAHLITSNETVELLSLVRLGVDLGVIPTLERGRVNQLFIQTQPAHLQKLEGRPLNPSERDARRAKLLRDSL
ncbi:MAG: protein arginine kinase [Candidatus Omnitrophica bacterium]|nr:protein arginine kinase [Candidatus Omnitrophota bacterium]